MGSNGSCLILPRYFGYFYLFPSHMSQPFGPCRLKGYRGEAVLISCTSWQCGTVTRHILPLIKQCRVWKLPTATSYSALSSCLVIHKCSSCRRHAWWSHGLRLHAKCHKCHSWWVHLSSSTCIVSWPVCVVCWTTSFSTRIHESPHSAPG